MTLSDKVIKSSILNQHIQVKDLKEAIKELKKEIERLQNKYDVVPMNYVFDGFEMIFGKELCE